jgi:inorganic triphosphatase YgiF
MPAHSEIELKLETDADGMAAVRRHPLLNGAPAKTVEQDTIYFDDAKGSLRRAGVSLRVRAAGGRFVQTVKQQGNGAVGLFARPEWERPVKGPKPDLATLGETPAGALVNGKPLQPTVTVQARRSIWDLDCQDGSIELVLDEGQVAAGKAHEAISEIEIELKGGTPASLFEMGRTLAGAAPLRIGVLTKAERGQRLADGSADKPSKSEAIRLSETMTTAQGFTAIVYSCLRQFRLNEPLIVRSRDPGALHQARVAMRRLRSAFTLFRPAIADARYEALRSELRWFTAQLGDARNLDVMLKRLPARGGKDVKALATLLGEAREQAYDRMLAALGSERLRLLLFDIVAWLETGTWRDTKRANRPLPGFAAKALTKRWVKVKERTAALAQGDPEAHHQLRIEVKKLRYTAEFLSSLVTEKKALARQKKALAALEAMQEQLGELNDRETARQTFAGLLAGRRDGGRLQATADRLVAGRAKPDRPVREAEKAAAKLLAADAYWH